MEDAYSATLGAGLPQPAHGDSSSLKSAAPLRKPQTWKPMSFDQIRTPARIPDAPMFRAQPQAMTNRRTMNSILMFAGFVLLASTLAIAM